MTERGAIAGATAPSCDLERHRVVALYPIASPTYVAKFLRDHAPPEVVSGDRAGVYAEAARLGVPHSVQLADRFHLLRISANCWSTSWHVTPGFSNKLSGDPLQFRLLLALAESLSRRVDRSCFGHREALKPSITRLRDSDH